jgi:drug/metabolite transporter (DMT)-like permease
MNAIQPTMGLVEWSLLAALSVLWGGSFFFVGIAVTGLPPFSIVALRVGLAAMALLLMVRATGSEMPKDRRSWIGLFGMGLLNNILPFSLIVWGQTHIASGLASILNATTPLFTVVAAHFLTQDEKMSGGRLAGVLMGLAGVVLMIGPDVLGGVVINVLAQFAVLGAAISYALAGIYGRRFHRQGIPPLITAAGQVTSSSVVLVPLAFATERPWVLPAPSLEIWLAVLGLAFLSTALAYVLYFRILAAAGATNVLLVTLLIPVSAILLGTTFLHEQLEPTHLAGMGFIGIGLAAIDGRPIGFLHRMRNGPRQDSPRVM